MRRRVAVLIDCDADECGGCERRTISGWCTLFHADLYGPMRLPQCVAGDLGEADIPQRRTLRTATKPDDSVIDDPTFGPIRCSGCASDPDCDVVYVPGQDRSGDSRSMHVEIREDGVACWDVRVCCHSCWLMGSSY